MKVLVAGIFAPRARLVKQVENHRNSKEWLFILNYKNCEAYRDKQIFALKTITK